MDLTIDRLSLSLGKRQVLHDVSAVLRPGRVTAILGANGSGKTTLVKVLAGLLPGDLRLGDRRIDALDPRERARAIGYLPQDGAVHWDVTVESLVALGRLPHRAPFAGLSPADEEAIARALAATETAELAHRLVAELSGGERARVLLARVLAGQPSWLLADEPLASLDPQHQLGLLDRLRALAGEGMGVVIVLHDLIQAARAADDVLLLREGRVVVFAPAAEALSPEHLRAAFGVEVMQVRDEAGRLLPVPIGRNR
ncbi:MAG: ABC transporter ATP-binding protein [Sphingomonas sp.]|uniref:ABC transporter ATP-binding protein n=1 Tax=Sphingomonas sp. TaxID=28214 RepID=UPI0025E05BD7|nr:ABC transporter ATP-binding protein [Sphingomonas sp.]MBX3563818.1 ABC transporter ATP-binding protein [Sphingomonas sp.]